MELFLQNSRICRQILTKKNEKSRLRSCGEECLVSISARASKRILVFACKIWLTKTLYSKKTKSPYISCVFHGEWTDISNMNTRCTNLLAGESSTYGLGEESAASESATWKESDTFDKTRTSSSNPASRGEVNTCARQRLPEWGPTAMQHMPVMQSWIERRLWSR